MNAPFFPPPGVRLGQWDRSLKDSTGEVLREARRQAERIEHARFVRDHHARKAAIYEAPLADRAAMTRQLERDTAAYSRGEDVVLAPVTVLGAGRVGA